MTRPSPRQAQDGPHQAGGDQDMPPALERLLDALSAPQSSKPPCPPNTRAGVWGASTSASAEPRCTQLRVDGRRCFGIPRRGETACASHREPRSRPRELVVLRDPRTGAPREVG